MKAHQGLNLREYNMYLKTFYRTYHSVRNGDRKSCDVFVPRLQKAAQQANTSIAAAPAQSAVSHIYFPSRTVSPLPVPTSPPHQGRHPSFSQEILLYQPSSWRSFCASQKHSSLSGYVLRPLPRANPNLNLTATSSLTFEPETFALALSLFTCRNEQETRLSALRSPIEFFDINRLSRPADTTQAVTVRFSFISCSDSGAYLGPCS